jgi:hypothetical protein
MSRRPPAAKSKKLRVLPRRARLRRFCPFGWRSRAHFTALRESPNRHSFYAIALARFRKGLPSI